MARAMVAIAAVALLAAAAVWGLLRRMVFFPDTTHPRPPPTRRPACRTDPGDPSEEGLALDVRRFPVLSNISQLDVPVTVVYGDRDTIVPAEQSRAVAEAARRLAGLIVVRGADHNDPALVHGDAVIDAVVALAQSSMDGS